MEVKPLSYLGPRIAILGPSNSGKSTLAKAIAKKTSSPAIHLDQLYHFPGTRWQARPKEAFLSLHRAAIESDAWVMDGNYSSCLNERLARATGVILLDINIPYSLLRYFRRTLFQRNRVGGVIEETMRDHITVEMLKFIIFTTPVNKRGLQRLVNDLSLPKIYISSPGKIKTYYQAWSL